MKHVVPLPLFTHQPQRCLGQDGHTDWQTAFTKVKGWIVLLAPVAEAVQINTPSIGRNVVFGKHKLIPRLCR